MTDQTKPALADALQYIALYGDRSNAAEMHRQIVETLDGHLRLRCESAAPSERTQSDLIDALAETVAQGSVLLKVQTDMHDDPSSYRIGVQYLGESDHREYVSHDFESALWNAVEDAGALSEEDKRLLLWGELDNPPTEEVEALVACLGDDAAQLRQDNSEDERAQTMDDAAEMLTRLELANRQLFEEGCIMYAKLTAAPAAPAEPTPAPTEAEYIPLPEAGWPLIELGFGLVEVAEGRQPVERTDGSRDQRPALIFGRNGSGKVGDMLESNRQMLPGEPLAVVTFANAESVDVVLGKLAIIRAGLASPTSAPEAGPQQLDKLHIRWEFAPDDKDAAPVREMDVYGTERDLKLLQARLDAYGPASESAAPSAHKLASYWFDEWELILPADARASFKDDLLASLTAPTAPAEPTPAPAPALSLKEQVEQQFPYHRTFNAIADAAKLANGGTALSISVIDFRQSWLESVAAQKVLAPLASPTPAPEAGPQPTDDALLRQALIALDEIALDLVTERLAQYREMYRGGHKPERVAGAQADVAAVQSAIAALRSRLASSPKQVPLTEEQIEAGRDATFSINNPFCPCDRKTMLKAVRWAERHHGIVAGKDGA